MAVVLLLHKHFVNHSSHSNTRT